MNSTAKERSESRSMNWDNGSSKNEILDYWNQPPLEPPYLGKKDRHSNSYSMKDCSQR